MPCRNFTVKLRSKIGQYLKRDLGRVFKMGDVTVHLYIDENDLQERGGIDDLRERRDNEWPTCIR